MTINKIILITICLLFLLCPIALGENTTPTYINEVEAAPTICIDGYHYIPINSMRESFNISTSQLQNYQLYLFQNDNQNLVLHKNLLIDDNEIINNNFPTMYDKYIPVSILSYFNHEVIYDKTNNTIFIDSPIKKLEIERSLWEYLGSFECTAYSDDPAENGGWNTTASGTDILPYHSIAVDPRVISLGTTLYVEGWGYGIAEDTGGAIKGSRLDLCMYAWEMNDWGRRNCNVYIVK